MKIDPINTNIKTIKILRNQFNQGDKISKYKSM